MRSLIVGSIGYLGGAQRVAQWGWFRITVASLVVIALMGIVFAPAIALPFPEGREIEPDLEGPPVDDTGGGRIGRDVPARIGVYRLIWREHCRDPARSEG
jgi:hypothetical protein